MADRQTAEEVARSVLEVARSAGLYSGPDPQTLTVEELEDAAQLVAQWRALELIDVYEQLGAARDALHEIQVRLDYAELIAGDMRRVCRNQRPNLVPSLWEHQGRSDGSPSEPED